MIRLSTRRRTLHTLLDANNINFLDGNYSVMISRKHEIPEHVRSFT